MTVEPVDTTLVSADTLQGIGVHDEFSIGRFIPFSDADAGLTDKIFSGKDYRTDYYAPAGRAEGQQSNPEKVSTDFSFILLSVCLLLVTLLTIFGRKSMVSGLASLSLRRQPDMSVPGTSEVISWPPILRNLFTIFNVSLFASAALLLTNTIRYENTAASITLTAIIAGSFLAALMLRHLTSIILAETTGLKSAYREYMNIIYNSWFADAIILFILNALILFAPVSNPAPFIWSGIIITAIFLIIRGLKLLTIFLNRHISISYFILYLCALEILPVLVILKILGVF
jgi:uncharacterized membrane protein